MSSRQDGEVVHKIAALTGRWEGEDKWHATSNHMAQNRLRSWMREHGDKGLSLLYALWKGQIKAHQNLHHHMTAEMHEAACLLVSSAPHPEKALTPAVRAMADVQGYLTVMQAELQQLKEKGEGQVEILTKESREFQADIEDILEMVQERIDISRRKLRTSPLHHINEEVAIARYQKISDGLQASCAALQDADGEAMIKQLNALCSMSLDWHDAMPAVCNSITAVVESSSESDSIAVLAGLPLQLMSDIMRMNQLACRMVDMWDLLGQEPDEYFEAAQVEF